MNSIFTLLAVFQLKHFLADYPLQNSFMLGKFKSDWGFLKPLLLHSWVHGILTYLICLGFTGSHLFSLKMYFLDLIVHFFVDRIKAGPKYLGRFKSLSPIEFTLLTQVNPPCRLHIKASQMGRVTVNTYSLVNPKRDKARMLQSNKLFWWSLGFDQMAHHLTHYVIIYLILDFKGLL